MMSDQEPSGEVDRVLAAPVVVDDAFTCLACGCLCDDLRVVAEGERITEAGNACALGMEWLLRDRTWKPGAPTAWIGAHPAAEAEAAAHAAQLLLKAKAPVILGLGRSTNETVAAALALADRVGASIEPDGGLASEARIIAFQRAGRVSATLGEVKNRADVVVFWGTDPLTTHPRHWDRYSVEPRGRFVPEGRAGRSVIVVDQARTTTAERADHFLQIDAGRQFQVLWTLRALGRGAALDEARVRAHTGLDRAVLDELVSRLKTARYGAFFHGPMLASGTLSEATANLEAAHGLVRDLNHGRRFVILGMGEPGNLPGAEAVSTWQTGFPSNIDYSAGSPRSLPGVTDAGRRLAWGQADLAVIVGGLSPGQLEAEARAGLPSVPLIVIAPPEDAGWPAEAAAVRCFAAAPGVEEAGTVTRVDGVSLPLRPVLTTSLPSVRAWLEAIRERIDLLRSE